MEAPEKTGEKSTCGLCADCRHVRRVRSQRASVFYLCQLAVANSSFPKYPALPVLACSGYDPLNG